MSLQEAVIDAEAAEEGRRLVVDLMRQLRAYDVMKETHKIIVYDTMLPFKHAYFSLVEYGEWQGRASSPLCCFLGGWVGMGAAGEGRQTN